MEGDVADSGREPRPLSSMLRRRPAARAAQHPGTLPRAQRRRTETLAAYLFLLPPLAVYGVFFLWPFVHLMYLSLQRWDGIGPRRWVWFANYARLLNDDIFWIALRNNVYWMLGAVVVPVVIGLGLAILLVRTRLHGRVVFRTLYFLPQVLSSVLVAMVWGWIYNPSFGVLNAFLETIGLASLRRAWLGEPAFALPALFVAWTWINYAFCMVIFIAALQSIDEVYFDAAKMDGANWWHQLRHVLLPFVRGPLTTVVLISAISAFQVYDLVFVTTQGGPGQSTLVMSIHMYNNAFIFARVGYGAAIAVVLGFGVLAFSLVLLRVRGLLERDQ